MSGIALVLHERGFVVTGSDFKTSRYIRQLTRAGVDIHVGHDAKTIDEVQPNVVVVSTAIPESNPELIRAREYGYPVGPAQRCFLPWAMAIRRLPLRAPMARRLRLLCAPRCSTAWVLTPAS